MQKRARCNVSGKVLDPRGKPVPGACVYWVDPRRRNADSVDRFHAHLRGTTDSDGRFWAVDLPAGPGLLVPDLAGCFFEGDHFSVAHGTPIDLPRGRGEPDLVVSFPLVPADFSRLNGTVADPDGNLLEGRRVAVCGPTDPPSILRIARTGPGGAFDMPSLPAGPARLLVWGDRSFCEGLAPIDLPRGATATATVRLVRRPPGERFRARIRCMDPLGLPVPGAVVRVLLPISIDVGVERTGEDGVAEFGDLPMRPPGATAAAEGFVPTAAALVPGSDGTLEAEIALRPLIAVEVVVRDAETGERLPHAGVLIRHKEMDAGVVGHVAAPHAKPTPAAFPLLPGTIRLRVEAPGYELHDQDHEIPAHPPVTPFLIEVPLPPRP